MEAEESLSAKALGWEGTFEELKRASMAGTQRASNAYRRGVQKALSKHQLVLMYDNVSLVNPLPAHQGLLRNTKFSPEAIDF